MFQPTTHQIAVYHARRFAAVSHLAESMKNDEIMRWANKALDAHTHKQTNIYWLENRIPLKVFGAIPDEKIPEWTIGRDATNWNIYEKWFVVQSIK